MIAIADTSTPVVVLGCFAHHGLTIIRSLGRLGVSVYGVDPSPTEPALFSRYCKGKLRWDLGRHSARSSVDYLTEISRALGRKPILIPSHDSAAMFVEDNADDLRQQFIFPKQPAGLARSLYSKKQMYYLAKQVDIPTAQSFFPQSRNEVLEFIEHVSFPLMLKGIDGTRLWKRAKKRMVIVHNREELLSQYDLMRDPVTPNLMLQEYIPGGADTVWMFNGYFNENSECLVGFTGKKIRQYPVYTGMTSLGICLRNEVVAETTRRFMKAVGYRGILDIGYKYDARDGQYKLLDVNPRVGATFRLFVSRNGMDVVRALYLDLTGQPVESDAACDGRKWLVEDFDTMSSFRYRLDGKLSATEWVHSFRGVQEAAYFALDDLIPFFWMFVNDTRRYLLGSTPSAPSSGKRRSAELPYRARRKAIG